MLTVVDRIPTQPGRILITPENGDAPFFASIARADEPSVIGTPLNKDLFDSIQDDLNKTIRVTLPENELPMGADLNDYTQPGSWVCNSFEVSATLKNFPIGRFNVNRTFRMTVYANAQEGTALQRIETTGGYVFQRVYVAGDGSSGWQPWVSFDISPWIDLSINNNSPTIYANQRVFAIRPPAQIDFSGQIFYAEVAQGFEAEIRLLSPISNGTSGTLEFHFLNTNNESIGYIPFVVSSQGFGSYHKGYLRSLNDRTAYSVAREPYNIYTQQTLNLLKPNAVRNKIESIRVVVSGNSTQVNIDEVSIKYRKLISSEIS